MPNPVRTNSAVDIGRKFIREQEEATA
jgi:hypothetical protein